MAVMLNDVVTAAIAIATAMMGITVLKICQLAMRSSLAINGASWKSIRLG
ncbi:MULTISPECIES: hypothetical protein [unclassified Synechococcus]|nr:MULTISPECIES: hypothetical protein [unclassified Synechococcus]